MIFFADMVRGKMFRYTLSSICEYNFSPIAAKLQLLSFTLKHYYLRREQLIAIGSAAFVEMKVWLGLAVCAIGENCITLFRLIAVYSEHFTCAHYPQKISYWFYCCAFADICSAVGNLLVYVLCYIQQQ